MEKRQMKDFMGVCDTSSPEINAWFPWLIINSQMYSKLVDKCFNDCIEDFTSKSVTPREEGCIMRCWDKNMKGQERIQQRLAIFEYRPKLANRRKRFQEHNEAMMSGGGLSR